jgi:hypothetical protein
MKEVKELVTRSENLWFRKDNDILQSEIIPTAIGYPHIKPTIGLALVL